MMHTCSMACHVTQIHDGPARTLYQASMEGRGKNCIAACEAACKAINNAVPPGHQKRHCWGICRGKRKSC